MINTKNNTNNKDEDLSNIEFQIQMHNLMKEYEYEDFTLKTLHESQTYLLSSKVRTLDDMTEEEIKNIEKTYNAKVIRREKCRITKK